MTNEESEFREDPEQLEHDVAHLRDWLTKQPHIHGRTDDEFLLKFLRGCKYSLERAKQKIDSFYTMKSALPEFFSNRDTLDPVMQEVFSLGYIVPLGTDEMGRRVGVLRCGLYDPSRVPSALAAKLNLMLLQAIVEDDGVELARGLVVIVDMDGMTLGQVAHIPPTILKKTIMVIQYGFPVRPKAIHFINMPPVLQAFFQLIVSCLKEKLKQRVHIHKNLQTLQEAIPKKNLPEEYGGSAGPIQDMIDKFRKNMTGKREFFLQDEQYGVDESKRPGKPVTHEDLFGFEGSFRQLNVD